MTNWLRDISPETDDLETAANRAEKQAQLLARYWDQLAFIENTTGDISYSLGQVGHESNNRQ